MLKAFTARSDRTAARLQLRYCPPSALSPAERDELWLFFSGFVLRSRAAFEAALDKTGELGLVTDIASGRLRAFVAVTTYQVNASGRPAGVIYTPWAAIAPECRGRNIVQRTGLRAYLREVLKRPLRPHYWMFTASTYTSYLLLTRNLRRYWPRRDSLMPAQEESIIAQVMAQTGETNWDRESGVVRRHGASRYREGVVDDDPRVLADPDIRFYATRNPGQVDGDTLVCLCPLTVENWLAIAGKAARRLLTQS